MTLEAIFYACQHENRQGQKALYERYASGMYRLCVRYLRDPAEAEDVVMEAFMNVFNGIGKLTFQNERAFEAWLKRIFINQSLMHLRQRKLFWMTLDPESLEISHPGQADDELSARELLERLFELPDGYRTVFNLYVIEGYSHQEIGTMLGISESTSKSQLHKARKALQELLKKSENGAKP
ncbi:RNA polymerase sigma factor [Larkinella knui]|uniref:Sigma-70 family RNA polymerase sigma factor n=1 Tax=Larkinella knui TaxID=2025310 RepID=A0A3P1CCI8_9BACT|nr:sigma-70 family RNA polymerase sigma factor [Larkinella knui]RRB11017.1 sigma-70 family RNA polymerase sigma factor [Larkinella knui]